MSRSILTHDVASPVIRHHNVTDEAILNRLEVYNKQTSPLIEYYASKGMLKNVFRFDRNERVQKILDTLND